MMLSGLVALINGCQTVKSNDSSTDKINTASDYDNDGANVSDREGVERSAEESEIIDEIAAEETLSSAGFCRDDIYTKYLVKRFVTDQEPLTRSGSRASRARNQRIQESHALHFAASRLKGLTSPYFGGLPVVMNQRVEFWIRYFKTSGRGAFLKWMVQGEALRKIVQPVLRNEGVPIELYYLAMIESGFNNRALSQAHATGTWQFMAGTAKLYGLNVSHWVDERRDPGRSTVAAARYLKELYGKFGDWYLAIAAYNAGPGRIAGAIRRGNTRDFWQLSQMSLISAETKDYVPKVLAAITIATNADQYGIQFNADPADEMPSSTLFVNRPVLLTEIAHNLGVSVEKLRRWNPELMQEIIPPASAWHDQPGYQLRIPNELKDRFIDSEATLTYLDIEDYQMHVIVPGETLAKIAQKYQISVGKILAINPTLSARRLKIGKGVAIPIPAIISKRKSVSFKPVRSLQNESLAAFK
jgi:membrane-bound lytic murein transglycosylase D